MQLIRVITLLPVATHDTQISEDVWHKAPHR
jgi:hypothetical protein